MKGRALSALIWLLATFCAVSQPPSLSNTIKRVAQRLPVKERLKKGALGLAGLSLSWFAVCNGYSTAQQSYECQDTDDYNALWASGLITVGVGIRLAYDGGRCLKQAIQAKPD